MKKRAVLAAVIALCCALCSAPAALGEGSAAVGDTVQFGNYPKGANGEVMPIEWMVLDIDEDGNHVLMSVYALDARPYNEDYSEMTWEDCSLRAWLNGEFFETAFNDEERARTKPARLDNADNFHYGTPGGGATEDRVYLLSLDEVTEYFGIGREEYQGTHAELVCEATEYAAASGAVEFAYMGSDREENRAKYGGGVRWWLRSPGYEPLSAAYVYFFGDVCFGGYLVDTASYGVRPVIRAALDQ